MNDIYYCIFINLDVKNIVNCSIVCKDFNNVCKSEILWKYIYMLWFDDCDLMGSYYDTCKIYIGIERLAIWHLRYYSMCDIDVKKYISNKKFYAYTRNMKIMPLSLFHLDKLEYLGLYLNKIEIIPTQIGLLTNLILLDLSSNKIKHIPTTIGLLTKLRRLNLYVNLITIIPTEIGLLTNLEILHLHNNYITAIPTEIGLLTNLNKLYLTDNKITTITTEIIELTQKNILFY